MTATKYVTTAELAAHFSVSNATIMAMMKSGEIPAGTYMRLGRVFRYDLDKIEQLLLTRKGSAGDAETLAQEPVQYEFDFVEDETEEQNPYA
jgi:predicted DNA-binding transcriptional regulator AlpA